MYSFCVFLRTKQSIITGYSARLGLEEGQAIIVAYTRQGSDRYDVSGTVSSLSWLTGRVLGLAAAVSLLCAALMFLALRHRDDNLFLYARAPTRVSYIPHGSTLATDTSVSQLPEAGPSEVVVGPSSAKRFFKIRRSRRFQSLGSLKLRLSRLNPQRPDLDVSFNVKGHLIEKKHVGVDQPITIAASKNTPAVEIVFDRITKDQVTGYVSQ